MGQLSTLGVGDGTEVADEFVEAGGGVVALDGRFGDMSFSFGSWLQDV